MCTNKTLCKYPLNNLGNDLNVQNYYNLKIKIYVSIHIITEYLVIMSCGRYVIMYTYVYNHNIVWTKLLKIVMFKTSLKLIVFTVFEALLKNLLTTYLCIL